MEAKVLKWGNSLGLRIPKAFAEEVGVTAGSAVDLSIADGNLVVRPQAVTYRLDDLLAAVTRANVHAEVRTGESRGREAW